MDAYSISHTSPSRRSSSRIYQDLAAWHLSYGSYSQDCQDSRIMNCTREARTGSCSNAPKICVVGAGISGLRCADMLLQKGFNVTILEARDRIGGRMYQTRLSSGHLVDLGPNWIHGTEHNPILDLAKVTKTTTHTWEEQVNVFDENGKLLEDGAPLSNITWGIIVQAFKHSAANTSTIDPKESLYDFFVKKVPEAFPTDSESQRKIILQMSEMWGAFVGSPVERQSLKFFWLEECIDGENLFCAGTYQNILELIAKPALDRADVKLSTKVTSVETTSAGTVKVFAENGQFDFDEVVITAPLGWLQRNKHVFSPPLPERFSEAIDSIGYGSLEKVYITFPRAFWLGDTSYPDDPPFTGFTQWLSPSYATGTNPKLWNQESVDLATLPKSCAHPTQLYYLFGNQSLALSNELTARHTQKERDEYLAKFFEPYFSLLPHYCKDSSDCIPVSFLATNWVADELAGHGSYTTFRTGLERGDEDIEIIREGLMDRKLWFAGEHCAPFVALGTVTGAYWSGEAVAKRIAQIYGMTAGNLGNLSEVKDIINTDGAKELNVRGFAERALEKEADKD